MADRPILFSAPMVQAILAGRKTVTRRVVAPHVRTRQSGDRLWVRETFSGRHDYDEQKWPPSAWFKTDPLWYWADGNPTEGDWTRPKPGIHMPRWASRLTLTVTDVKVERLQDITDEQALAEGVTSEGAVAGTDVDIDGGWWPGGPVRQFARLWGSINGPESWDANPSVAAYTFTAEHRNIDA